MNTTRLAAAFRARNIPPVWYYAAIIVVSLVMNWFVQLGYFLYMTHLNPHVFDGERTLVDYTTGFVGDVVICPLINVCILYIVLRSAVKLSRISLMAVAVCGLLADALLHFFQGYLKLTNWSMPQPYAWDFVSYWHMVSFFFQISFVILFVYMVLRGVTWKDRRLTGATYAVFVLMTIFMALFVWDYLPVHSWSSDIVAAARHWL